MFELEKALVCLSQASTKLIIIIIIIIIGSIIKICLRNPNSLY